MGQKQAAKIETLKSEIDFVDSIVDAQVEIIEDQNQIIEELESKARELTAALDDQTATIVNLAQSLADIGDLLRADFSEYLVDVLDDEGFFTEPQDITDSVEGIIQTLKSVTRAYVNTAATGILMSVVPWEG